MKLVEGDLFDGDADVLVVPCSTGGSMSAEIRSRLRALGVSLSERQLEPGQVVPVAVEKARGRARMVLFSAVVVTGGATPEVVEAAARRAGESAPAGGSVTAFPLLGSGAGGLSPESSVRAMTAGFLGSAPVDARMHIHVLSHDLFDRLRQALPDGESMLPEPSPEPPGISPSAEQAASSVEANVPVPASVVVSELLSAHPEYGGGRARRVVLSDLEDAARMPARGWLTEVATLFDGARTPVLHGRLVIIGLTLLSPALRTRLEDGGFLQALIEELEEPLAEILTAKGAALRDLRSPAQERDEVVPTHTDNPALVDELGRRGFARILARRIREVRAVEKSNAAKDRGNVGDQRRGGAFLVHLYAPWGAGKTSLLNFLAAELRKPEAKGPTTKRDRSTKPFVVVNFNAWRHQRIAPPWWWLMTTLYAEAVRELRRMDWLRAVGLGMREWWWRARGGWLGLFVLLLGVLVLVAAWQNGYLSQLQGEGLLSLETVRGLVVALAAVVTPVLTVWGLVRGVGRWIFATSARGARRFIDNTRDPMRIVHQHLRDLVRWIHYDVVILIDDLDRCRGPYVVELLEGIQTLFRDVPLTYVVAADQEWLSDSFAVEYRKFSDVASDPGRPIGYLFLEKTFQITTALPAADARIEAYWGRLLRSATLPGVADVDRATEAAKAELGSVPIKEARQLVAARPGLTAAEVQARREVVAVEMASEEAAEEHSHTLEPFRQLIGSDANPRMMKRLVNAYGIARGVETLYGYNLEDNLVQEQETALWTVLNLRWPRLGAHLSRFPQHIDAIGQGKPPADVPHDLRPLFTNSKVVDVIQGRANEVRAHLDAGNLQAMLHLEHNVTASPGRS